MAVFFLHNMHSYWSQDKFVQYFSVPKSNYFSPKKCSLKNFSK